MGSNHTAHISQTPVLADIKLIHPHVDYMTPVPNETYDRVNALYLDEFGRNMTRYGGNLYDAVWMVSLTIIETQGYNNKSFIKTFPETAKRYNGTSGNYKLNEYGNRLHGDYYLYMYISKGSDVIQVEIGYYSSKIDECREALVFLGFLLLVLELHLVELLVHAVQLD